MKRIPAVFFAFFIIILAAACTAQSTPAPAAIAQAPAVTITSLPSATTTATALPTAAPSETPSPTATTPALPSSTPPNAYAQECITIEDDLPADLGADGALLLYGGRYASVWNNTMFHFDLMSHRRSPLPYSAVELARSPDGKWLAYLQLGYDGLGRVSDRFLRVTDAEGRHLNLSYWGLNWQTLIGWQDAEHLLLHVPGQSGSNYILLNPFTGIRTAASAPTVTQLVEANEEARSDEEILAASPDGNNLAGWVQLKPPGSGYPFANDLVLMDTERTQITDLCFENQVPSDIGWVDNQPPIWSPDGRFLAVAVSRITQRSNSRYTQEVLIWDAAVIDLQARRGYVLAKDARPRVWMVKP